MLHCGRRRKDYRQTRTYGHWEQQAQQEQQQQEQQDKVCCRSLLPIQSQM
jgi:hypothetical protein